MSDVGCSDGGPRRRRIRHALSSLASLAAAAFAHVLGGVGLTDSCATALGVLALASVVTGTAGRVADQTRGPWLLLGVLALGQSAVSLLVLAPRADIRHMWSLTAGVSHAISVVALGIVVVGFDRARAGVVGLADEVCPRWWSAGAPSRPSQTVLVAAVGRTVPEGQPVCWTPLRGPPFRLAARSV